jgi:hypothetical protein
MTISLCKALPLNGFLDFWSLSGRQSRGVSEARMLRPLIRFLSFNSNALKCFAHSQPSMRRVLWLRNLVASRLGSTRPSGQLSSFQTTTNCLFIGSITRVLLSFPEVARKYQSIMRPISLRAAVLSSAGLLVALPVGAAANDLPSGVDAELHEVLVEEIGDERWIRFRFLAPGIDRARPDAPAFADLEPDFPHLCSTLALPYLTSHALTADKVIISIADRVVEFGQSNPDATQYFEQFRIDDGTCLWEAF